MRLAGAFTFEDSSESSVLSRLRLGGCVVGDAIVVFGDGRGCNGFINSEIGCGACGVLSLPLDSDVKNRNMRSS